MATNTKTIEDGEARRRLIAWISDERGCDNSCLAQLYSIIEPDPVAVITGGQVGDTWEGGSPAAPKNTYTVRIEWPVTYYCDTTVEATNPEEAARIAMEEPDYDSQRSYDEPGDCIVQGVCEGDEYRWEDRTEVGDAGLGESVAEASPRLLRALGAILMAAQRGPVAEDSREIIEASELLAEIEG